MPQFKTIESSENFGLDKAADGTVVSVQKNSPFGLNPVELSSFMAARRFEAIAELNGVEGIAAALKTDLNLGLRQNASDSGDHTSLGVNWQAESSFIESQRVTFFGQNVLPEAKQDTIFEMIFDAIQDKTLLLLIGCSVLEIAIGVYKKWFAPIEQRDAYALVDGIAIVIGVVVVVTIASFSDYHKQTQFKKLSDFSRNLSEFKVIRGGIQRQISTNAILVGDICLIQTGDILPADGLLLQGFNVEIDESTLTGEPHAIEKNERSDPFLFSGTSVLNGTGRMLVVSTGVNTQSGQTILSLEVELEQTPLQEKLEKIADLIANFAIYAASAMVIILVIIYFAVNGSNLKPFYIVSNDVLSLLILAVTIVVVAVPEGLPLAVTLSLAHATIKMLQSNNLVRHLSACETMGNATTICSDKTGTLTMNTMKVVDGSFMGIPVKQETDVHSFKDAVSKSGTNLSKEEIETVSAFLAFSLNANSTADEISDKNGVVSFKGSKTEVAILELTTNLGYPYKVDRKSANILHVEPFSSETKKMATIVQTNADPTIDSQFGTHQDEPNSRRWLLVKGAAEVILEQCSKYFDKTGAVRVLTVDKRDELKHLISNFGERTLRTIFAGIQPLTSDEAPEEQARAESGDLILFGLFGIEDPIRPEVPDAVTACQKAGITIRMVTGDNILTAKAIARKCGILSNDGVAMEGQEFRTLSETEMNTILPKLQVLARSSPLDKQILVKNLKRLGETVAVTGDGTNDAPALTSADVGFSMGISGTEVAKQASDIVLIDDNFASIVHAVMWGRCVYDSIRKFLQFQLAVNTSAFLITVITSFSTIIGPEHTPYSAFSAVQLLWLNLIMDTMAALALATDPPTPELLNRKPSSRKESMISPLMAAQIIGQAIYQITIILILYYCGPQWWGSSLSPEEQISEAGVDIVTATIVFNTFVFCQIFNEVNNRSITRDVNIFKNFFGNKMFLFILFVTIFLQVMLVEFGGAVFKTNPEGLSFHGWLISIGLGSLTLPIGFIIRILPDPESLPGFNYLQQLYKNKFKKSIEFTEESDQQPDAAENSPERRVSKMRRMSRRFSTKDNNDLIEFSRIQRTVANAFKAPFGSKTMISEENLLSKTSPNLSRRSSVKSPASRRRVDKSVLQLVDISQSLRKLHSSKPNLKE